jgi:hypothetical protein
VNNDDLSGDLSSLPADYDPENEVESQAKPKGSTSSSQRRSKSRQLDVQDSDEEMDDTLVDQPSTTQTRKPTASQSQVPAKKGSGMKRSDGNQGRKKN